jgi:hypothetical protein
MIDKANNPHDKEVDRKREKSIPVWPFILAVVLILAAVIAFCA